MDVEVGRAAAADTPASVMQEYVVSHMIAVMTICGIESISSISYRSGYGSRLHVSMVPFHDAPKEVVEQGFVTKDAIAQILSVANITRVVIKPSEDDLKSMSEQWDETVKELKVVSGGSGQDFSGPNNTEELK